MHKHMNSNCNFFLLLISILTLLIIISPLLINACIEGHDILYHLLRIESLKNGILIGKPYLKINTLFFNNAGYASSLFYPDIMLYFPAFLRIVGFSISRSYNMFIIFCVIMCYINVYYCSKLIIKNKYGAITASIVYTLCQYHIDDIYVRAAIGEVTAFVFIPLIFFGIYDVLYNNFQKPWIMILGFIGIMLSHTSTLLMCLFLYFIFFCFHMKTFINKPFLLYKLIVAAIVVLLLTAFYWIPVIEQMAYDSFRFNQPWVFPSERTINISTLLSNKFTGMGFIIFGLCLSRLFVIKTNKNNMLINFADKCMLIGILLSLSTTNFLPWYKFDKYISVLQFPWRLHIISSFCLSISVAIYFSSIFYSKKYDKYGLYIIVLFMSINALITFSRINISYVAVNDNYFDNSVNSSKVQAGEWLPLAVNDVNLVLNNSNKVVANTGKTLPFTREQNTILVDFTQLNTNEKIDYIDVPFIYYKGYGAYQLNKYNGIIKLEISGNGNNGFCRVIVPNDCSGTILIKYDGTKIQDYSNIVTISTMILVFIYHIIECKYINKNIKLFFQ